MKHMTPSEKNIASSLVAVAWADGTVKEPEVGMIDSLLWAFGATEPEEAEIKEFAEKKRTIKDDVPLTVLAPADRELLLAHAALRAHSDGKQTKAEEKVLRDISEHLSGSPPPRRALSSSTPKSAPTQLPARAEPFVSHVRALLIAQIDGAVERWALHAAEIAKACAA